MIAGMKTVISLLVLIAKQNKLIIEQNQYDNERSRGQSGKSQSFDDKARELEKFESELADMANNILKE